MVRRLRWVTFAIAASAAAFVACGTNSAHQLGEVGAPGDGLPGGSPGSSHVSSSGSSSSSGAPGGATGFGAIGDGGGGLANFADAIAPPSDASFADSFVGCAAESQQAKQLPLDLAFMLDSSSSMSDLAAAGTSKWSAVVSAVTNFVNDPASAGIGVGLQYFPLIAAGVPASCTSGADCGSAGPCVLGLCLSLAGQTNQTIICDDVSGCPRGMQCAHAAFCSGDPNTICTDLGTSCGMDGNGFSIGTCPQTPLTTSTCGRGDSCTAADYATYAVPVAALPGAAAAVITSLGAHSPNGNTPTAAALTGVIDGAQAYARAHPTDTVVAVLATDGQPDECTPTDTAGIAQIAAAGLAGTPSIKTFAIGVFSPNDTAAGTQVLDAIASAGGTGQAFVLQSTGNLGQQFQAALDSIRGASLPCQYALPTPASGTPDFNKVNVQYTAGSGSVTTIPYVETPAQCDATAGGWYYDADPKSGGTPTEILTCAATCTTIKGDSQGRVDVVLGCATVIVVR
ncbi:MAG: hypothetical protein FWD17_14460 [Polyangiaceae bacterium]|nr:hypothetical protein [Polyangiaceae bacterium]